MTPPRVATAIGVALLALGAAGTGVAAGSAPPTARAAGAQSRQVAMLTTTTPVRVTPAPGARRMAMVKSTRPITGAPTVLPVIARTRGADGAPWMKVLLPGRPNGHSGWIPAASADVSTTSWSVTIRLSTRRVTVFRDGRSVRSYSAVVGTPSTPTPSGRFFVEEIVALRAHHAGAPYALALSARSEVFQEFAGGPGQVAIHGIRNVGGTPGTAASHGCVRLETAPITWMAAHLGPGTMVTISG